MNVQAELRWLKDRVTALEALTARPRRKRAAAPRPDDAVVSERVKLWSKYLLLEMQFGHGRMRYTYLAFAMRHGVNPTEFGRWLSPTDRRGIPEGSKPDRSHRRELNAAIAELEQRRVTHGQHSRGNVAHSQNSAMRLQ